jgi:hypothetical protein
MVACVTRNLPISGGSPCVPFGLRPTLPRGASDRPSP